MPYTIRYSFSQHFSVLAHAAYDWCTDYQPDDHALVVISDAKRIVTWITDEAVLVKDTFTTASCDLEKEKLVHLNPEKLTWTSTYLTGPNMYSQFTYKIIAEDEDASRLEFEASHVEYKENLTRKALQELTVQLSAGDAEIWKLFARAMAKELVK